MSWVQYTRFLIICELSEQAKWIGTSVVRMMRSNLKDSVRKCWENIRRKEREKCQFVTDVRLWVLWGPRGGALFCSRIKTHTTVIALPSPFAGSRTWCWDLLHELSRYLLAWAICHAMMQWASGLSDISTRMIMIAHLGVRLNCLGTIKQPLNSNRTDKVAC